MNVADRINRILLIMSYVSQNQGIWLDDLAKKVEMRPQDLLKELEFMLLIGKPPFRPDDYVDIYVEDRRVFIEFDQMLNRPCASPGPKRWRCWSLSSCWTRKWIPKPSGP